MAALGCVQLRPVTLANIQLHPVARVRARSHRLRRMPRATRCTGTSRRDSCNSPALRGATLSYV
eukprot:683829-Pyramimonas_sp.AAC.1